MISFKRYLREKDMNIYISDKEIKGAKLLGIIDSNDYDGIVGISNEIQSKIFENICESLVVASKYDSNKKLIEMVKFKFKKYFKGTTEQLNNLKNDIDNKSFYNVSMKSGSYDSTSNVGSYYEQKYGLSKDAIMEIANTDDTYGSISIGKGEFVLGLFTNLTNKPGGEGGGDLLYGSKKVEVKVTGGRPVANKSGKIDGQAFIKRLNDMFKSDLVLPKTGNVSKKYIGKSGLLEYLKKELDPKKEMNNITDGKMTAKESVDKLANDFCTAAINADISDPVIVSAAATVLKEDIKSMDSTDLCKFILSIHTTVYIKMDKIDYFIFYTAKDKNSVYDRFFVWEAATNFKDIYKFIKSKSKTPPGWNARASYGFSF